MIVPSLMLSGRMCAQFHRACVVGRAVLTSGSRAAFSVLASMENKIDVAGVGINYVKVGNGPHHILLTPGALGSIWTDFRPQIEHFNRSEFTIVAWDPPGYGNSVPPKRDFSPGFLYRDANLGARLMKELGVRKYSLMGWHNGGTSSMIIAANNPDEVINLIVWGSCSFINEQETLSFKDYRDHSLTSPRLKDPCVPKYGEENYNKIWVRWRKASISVFESETDGDICSSLLPKIKCPTLILHGRKDENISEEHPRFLSDNIKNSRFLMFDEGYHHLHLHLWKEFNRLAEYFLLEDTQGMLQW